jgi:5-formyltetrahydrofolate cyclo-ligase
MMDLTEEKKILRANAADRRAKAHVESAEIAPNRLILLEFPCSPVAGYSVVSGFYPYESEIDVRPLLGKLGLEGWTPSLPVILGKNLPLEFRRWYPGELTVPGRWNIPRPVEDAPVVVPDVLLVPLLAFDRAGYRLGYGGGFYDRTLADLKPRKRVVAIGVAYAAQEVDFVPRGPHDEPLDFIMTDREVIRCG